MLKKTPKTKLIAFAVLAVVVIVLPFFMDNQFYLQFLVTAAITAISVIGFDVISGNLGYTSFGHSAFMGLGAFTLAILVKKVGMDFWTAMLLAVIFTGGIAYLLSIPTFRLSGLYFSIGTMAFSQVFYLIAFNWTNLTGGTFGISGITSPFATMTSKYYFSFFMLFLIGFLVYRMNKSPIGDAFRAIKENEALAESIGIATTSTKRFAFTLSAMIAALAGAMVTGLLGFANPASYTMTVTLEYLVMDVVGGGGTLIGPAIAAFILKIFSQALAELQELRLAIYGVLLILTVMYMPGGVAGIIKTVANKTKQKKEG